jgi:hypothetical protein
MRAVVGLEGGDDISVGLLPVDLRLEVRERFAKAL